MWMPERARVCVRAAVRRHCLDTSHLTGIVPRTSCDASRCSAKRTQDCASYLQFYRVTKQLLNRHVAPRAGRPLTSCCAGRADEARPPASSGTCARSPHFSLMYALEPFVLVSSARRWTPLRSPLT
jgi:hypothetical protein